MTRSHEDPGYTSGLPEPVTGLDAGQRERLFDLRDRAEAMPYPKMLGLPWDADLSIFEDRIGRLLAGINAWAQRLDLNADDRAAIDVCRGELESARWLFSQPEIARAYLTATRSLSEDSTL